jgi:hypothetical protein
MDCALDPTHKLVLSLVVGEHEEEQAVNLLRKLKAVVVMAAFLFCSVTSYPIMFRLF